MESWHEEVARRRRRARLWGESDVDRLPYGEEGGPAKGYRAWLGPVRERGKREKKGLRPFVVFFLFCIFLFFHIILEGEIRREK